MYTYQFPLIPHMHPVLSATDRPLRILDVSCGAGLSSVLGAARGHNVPLGTTGGAGGGPRGELSGAGKWLVPWGLMGFNGILWWFNGI